MVASEMRRYTAYVITNAVTGKMYVGVSINPQARIACHRSRKPWLLDGGFEFDELACCLGRDNATWLEQLFVRQLGTLAPDGYNATAGGFRAFEQTPEIRAKIGEANRGKQPSADARQRMREARAAWLAGHAHPNAGRTFSAEIRAKMSAAHKGKPNGRLGHKASAETRAKMSAAHKRLPPRSEATRQKLSEALQGHAVSDATREKLRAAGKRRTHSPETRAKIKASLLARHSKAPS